MESGFRLAPQVAFILLWVSLRRLPLLSCREGKVTATIAIGEVLLIHVNKHVTSRTRNDHVIVDLAK